MRFSPASRLTDRQTVWVGYRNDGTSFNRISAPDAAPATVIAGQFAEVFADDVTPCPISGWKQG